MSEAILSWSWLTGDWHNLLPLIPIHPRDRVTEVKVIILIARVQQVLVGDEAVLHKVQIGRFERLVRLLGVREVVQIMDNPSTSSASPPETSESLISTASAAREGMVGEKGSERGKSGIQKISE